MANLSTDAVPLTPGPRYTPCPWSKAKLKALGKSIRDSTEVPAGVPTYVEVMAWYNRLVGEAQRFLIASDWEPLLGPQHPSITGRFKTEETLRDKLQRQPDYKVPSIQDVAGVRFEADMRLDQQDAVVQSIVAHNLDGGVPAEVLDRRSGDHAGYRSVHVILRPPGACPIEVQVRTSLQGRWANLYETLADKVGREIRYGGIPRDKHLAQIVQLVEEISVDLIARYEAQQVKLFTQMTRVERLQNPAKLEVAADLEGIERHLGELGAKVEHHLEWVRQRLVEAIPSRDWSMVDKHTKGPTTCLDS